ncbi:MAG: hypothetical protein LBK99_10850 [Opitutaceae bacterium]|jgi:hypothetical protein|nr:hypothetical protein [Opitutaceae bacterium]
MKTSRIYISATALIYAIVAGKLASSGIPVIDAANLANDKVSHMETIAKWAENISQLHTQIDQLNQQINIQNDVRKWTGNPVEAGGNLLLDVLGEKDLMRTYGKARDEIVRLTGSLDSFHRTADGTFRSLETADINGDHIRHDALMFRRYSVLDTKQQNTVHVTDATRDRTTELSQEIALTLQELKTASTDAEVQKLNGKLAVLNGQLAQVETTRRREVDEVILQKIANDNRREMERIAAAELAAKDEQIANQRLTAFIRTLNPRKFSGN